MLTFGLGRRDRGRWATTLVVLAVVALSCGGPSENAHRTPGAPASGAIGSAASGTAAPKDLGDPAAEPQASFDPAHVTLTLDQVVTGLDAPIGVTAAGDGSGR